jgi:hypothetical protein
MRGFVPEIALATRPPGYMANGSFQGKLLSVYETKTGFTDAPEDRGGLQLVDHPLEAVPQSSAILRGLRGLLFPA